MRNNNIMDEDFGQEIPEPQASQEQSWHMNVLSLVVVACILSVMVALTVRLDRWILH